MKTITYIVLAYLVVVSSYLLWNQFHQEATPNIYQKDSTIVYVVDSNIYRPNIDRSTIINPISKYYYYGTDTGICDSLRWYKPSAENDSIRLEANVVVHGKLIDAGITYQWKRPILTVKTIKEYYPVEVFKSGLFTGVEINYNNNYIPTCPPLNSWAFGGQIGYLFRVGSMLEYGYNTNNIHSLRFSKILEFKSRKK